MISNRFTSEFYADESPGFHGSADEGIAFHAINELNIKSIVYDEFEFYPSIGLPWIGRFQRAVDKSSTKLLYSTPVPTIALVVAGQQGYIVDVLNRTARSLPSPVLQVEACTSPPILVLADFTTLTLMSVNGEICRSPHLVTDDLKILRIEDNFLTIEGFVGEFGDIRKSLYKIEAKPLGVHFVKWL